MVLERVRAPLVEQERRLPEPGAGQVRLAIEACGVCRTDLHVVDGELPDPALPLVPGHQIVGIVDALGHREFIMGYKSFEPAGPACLPAVA